MTDPRQTGRTSGNPARQTKTYVPDDLYLAEAQQVPEDEVYSGPEWELIRSRALIVGVALLAIGFAVGLVVGVLLGLDLGTGR